MNYLLSIALGFAFLLPSLALQAKDWKSVETFTSDKASRPYVIMGQLSEKARTGKSCVRQMAKKTAKKDGDAMVNVKIGATGAKGMWVGSSVMHCTGVAVRWARQGETGLTGISEDTAVPFLFQ